MKKFFMFVSLIGILTACQTVLEETQSDSKGKVLALVGGGFLSEDKANDINPFIFTDLNGQSWMFFASDRGGGQEYNLYAAKMHTNGVFEVPVRLSNNVNTVSNETSPVVMQDSNGITLAFLREGQLYTADLSADLQVVSTVQFQEFAVSSNLGLIQGTRTLLSAQGNQLFVYEYNAGGWSSATTNNTGFAVFHASGYTNRYGRVYIVETESGGHRQLAGGVEIPSIGGRTNASMWFTLQSTYGSTNNDKMPFVDYRHGDKVYFASDRYGLGYYDLYRYNDKRYTSGDSAVSNLYATLMNGDSGLPSLTLLTVVPAATNISNWTLELTNWDEGSGVENLVLSQNNALLTNIQNPPAYFKIGVDLQIGTNLFSVWVSDYTGLSSNLTSSLIFDTTPPVGSFNITNNQVLIYSNQDIILEALNDWSGLGSVSNVILNAQTWTNSIVSSPSFTLPLSSLLSQRNLIQGTNTVSFVPVDKAGNVGSNVSVSFVLDYFLPVLSFDSYISNNMLTNASSIYVSGSATLSTFDAVQTLSLTSPVTQQVNWSYDGVYYWHTTTDVPLAEGTNSLVVEMTTSNGKSAVLTNRVIKDTTPPVFTITSPTNNGLYFNTNNTLMFAGSAQDAYGSVVTLHITNRSFNTNNDSWTNTTNFNLMLSNGVAFSNYIDINSYYDTNRLDIYSEDSLGNISSLTSIIVYYPVPQT